MYEQNWTDIRKDLNQRPVEGIDGKSPENEIQKVLAKYGITAQQVELWGTGQPLREFCGVKKWLMPVFLSWKRLILRI